MTMQKSKLLNSLVAIVLLSGASISASYAADAEKAVAAPLLAANAGVTDEAITASAKAALSADAQLAGLPIIMISSRTADKHRNVARELGVQVFLGKPYRDDELLGHIAGFLAGPAAAN